MPITLQLNCLIEGEDIVFPVTAKSNEVVGDLKKLIQGLRVLDTLKGVGAQTLDLWKVDIDLNPYLDDRHSLIHLKLVSMEPDSIKELQPWLPISDYWGEPPARFLHIIVKAPPTDMLSHYLLSRSHICSPTLSEHPSKRIRLDISSPHLNRQDTEKKMAAALEGFEKYFKYLATGKLDGHLDSIRPKDKLTKFGVDLPIKPTLLLHDLGKYPDRERIKDLFKPMDGYRVCTITHLFNVSGSGKTRLSLDGLCSHWGLYISCKIVKDTASGSNDFMAAMNMLQSISLGLSNTGPAARRVFRMLLCARVFILEQLVQRFPVETNITDARRRWVLAQVLPPRLLNQSEDLFVKVLLVLQSADTDIMDSIAHDLLRNILTKRTDLFPEKMGTPLFVVIDEAQVAAEYLKFFPSTSGSERRPILREMVGCFQSSRIFDKIILSGTGLSMEMVKGAVGSLSAKHVPSEVQRVFTNVGRFTSEDFSQEDYVRRYLNLSDDNLSDKRLLERIKYWFSGRYRLTANLVEIFLHSQSVPRHRVLTSFVEHLTGFKLTDAIELEDGETPISADLNNIIKSYQPLTELRRLFKEEGLSNRMQLINRLTDALMRWTLGSEPTSIPIEDNMQEMIALGVGFLANESWVFTREREMNLPVYISEPLVVLSLRSLFETQAWTTRKEQITRFFRNALNSPTLGYVLEMALPLLLMERFGGKFSRLKRTFVCGSKSLGSRKVTLVSMKCTAGGEMQTCPVSWNSGSSDRLGLKAKTPTHVLEFLNNPDGKTFLFPDNMRPDLLWFFQDEETKELIVCIDQSKLSLNSKTWKNVVDAVTPQFFYTMMVKGARVQYSRVSRPTLKSDLERNLKTLLGEVVASSNLNTLRSGTEAVNGQSPSTSRKTPRFLRIISSPNDKRLDGKNDLALLRWEKMRKYIGSTTDSVK